VLGEKVNPAQIGRLQAIPKYIFKERWFLEKGVMAEDIKHSTAGHSSEPHS